MGGYLFHSLAVIVILRVNGVLLRICFTRYKSELVCKPADLLSVFGIIGDALCNNIARASKCLLAIFYSLFRIDKAVGDLVKAWLICCSLLKNEEREGLESLFLSDGCSCFSVGTEGTVYIVYLGNRNRVFDSFLNFGGELILCANKLRYLFSSLFDIAKIV